MPDTGIDVLMTIVNKRQALAGESTTTFAKSTTVDTLRTGFEPGFCSELQEFSFSAGVGGSLTKRSKKAQKKAAEEGKKETESTLSASGQLIQSQTRRYFKRRQSEFVDMQPVEYTRVLDTSSTLLFNALTGCETLDSISVAKRKASGTANSGEIYLRLDFIGVLMINLDWKDNQNNILESGTFIYRQLKIRYRPQLSNGSFGTIVNATWAMQGASQK